MGAGVGAIHFGSVKWRQVVGRRRYIFEIVFRIEICGGEVDVDRDCRSSRHCGGCFGAPGRCVYLVSQLVAASHSVQLLHLMAKVS